MRALILALALAAPAAAAERVVLVAGFERVRVEGPYRVEIVTGRGASARLSGAPAAIERVTVDQQGQSLLIRPNRLMSPETERREMGGPVTIRLTTGELRAAILVGSGVLSVDRMRGPRADLTVSGSGEIGVATLDSDRLDIAMQGAGRMRLAGAAKAVTASVRGSATLDAPALTAGDLTLRADSSGAIAIGARGAAKVIATGAGETVIGGKPSCEVDARGAGTVTCGGRS